VLRAAQESGPQEITLRGEGVAVIVARADYDRLTGRKGSFVEFLRRSPLGRVELRLRRARSATRRVEP
jgi:prevent-host-death family protein